MKRMVFLVVACLVAASAYAQGLPVCPQTQSCQNPCSTVLKCPGTQAAVVTDLAIAACAQGGSTFSCPAGQTVHMGESCCSVAKPDCPTHTCKFTCEPALAASKPDHSPLTPTEETAPVKPAALDTAIPVPGTPAAVSALDCTFCNDLCRCHQHPDTKEVILFCAAP